ncbi:zf-TFIIB domain-containing protein [Patescibacteria group bacterium]|nr:zf-TFIIB domain-containing protein [Patescibacteria group bacterium]
MSCPFCKENLEKAIFYGVEIDYCPKCLGLWFEEEELRLAKDKKDESLNWLDIDLWKERKKFKISKGQKLCPSCRLPFYEVNYGDSKISVDFCNICLGVWLDRGEFRKIIEYLRKRKDYEVFNNFIKKVAEELWEVFTGPEAFREEVLDFLTVLKLLNYKFIVQHPAIFHIIAKLPR